jgi:hypothetical protein
LYHYRIPGSRQAARDGFQVAVDLSPALHQVIVHLQAKEEPLREAKITRQPKIGIRGNVPFAEHDLIDARSATCTARASAFWLRSIGLRNSSSRISPG